MKPESLEARVLRAPVDPRRNGQAMASRRVRRTLWRVGCAAAAVLAAGVIIVWVSNGGPDGEVMSGEALSARGLAQAVVIAISLGIGYVLRAWQSA